MCLLRKNDKNASEIPLIIETLAVTYYTKSLLCLVILFQSPLFLFDKHFL
nr:MAG TPA: hypothetical protein [Caudoviricetes sp.]